MKHTDNYKLLLIKLQAIRITITRYIQWGKIRVGIPSCALSQAAQRAAQHRAGPGRGGWGRPGRSVEPCVGGAASLTLSHHCARRRRIGAARRHIAKG